MKTDKHEREVLLRVADELCAWITAHTEDMAQAAEELVPLAWHSEIAHREGSTGDIRTWDVAQFRFDYYRKGCCPGVLMGGGLHRTRELYLSRRTNRVAGEACAGMDFIVPRAAAWLRHPRFAEDAEMACRRAVTAPNHHGALILRDREGVCYIIETALHLNGNAGLGMKVMPDWCEYWCADAQGAAWGGTHRWERQKLSRSSVPGGYEVVYRGR